MGETKRVSKPMKKSAQQLQSEVAEIHQVPDLIRDENGGQEEEEEEEIVTHHHPSYLHHQQQQTGESEHRPHSRLVSSEEDLLELEFDEEILELHGYHHQPASLVGHVSCSFVPFDTRSAASTAASPTSPSLLQRPLTSISTSSTVAAAAASSHHQLYSAASQESCASYFKLTGPRTRDPTGRLVSDATKEENQDIDDDEASLRELLMRYTIALHSLLFVSIYYNDGLLKSGDCAKYNEIKNYTHTFSLYQGRPQLFLPNQILSILFLTI